MSEKSTQLFLLHFAGGNRYSYNFLKPFLGQFEITAIELPGRGKRPAEPLLTAFELALEDTMQQISQNRTHENILIYGHSMGAMLGLAASHLLEQQGKGPRALVVSGNAGPGTYERKQRYKLSRQEFIDELLDMGGLPEGLIANKELFDFFEPVLRADFQVAEDDYPFHQVHLQLPIFAIMGNEEEHADKIGNWQRFTASKFESEIVPGDHFFIHQYGKRIAEIICGSRALAQLDHTCL